ncbi:hypothetical protein [Streptomyces sp. NBC_00197]|jgi:transposase-like protein|uniref:hypothetical protein n=1 Tax=Streptomyces sp. NBC_00197 TaxID=2975676 RepID=UPI003244798C
MDKDALIAKIVSRGRDENGHIRSEAIYELLAIDGVNVVRVAKEFGVSRAAIYKRTKARKEVLPQSLKSEIMRHSPWKDVEPEHTKAAQRAYVAHHIEWVLSGGKIDDWKVPRLRRFYRELGDPQDKVLTYDRNEPPNQWSDTGGWKYVPREESDGDLILRTDDPLTEEQKRVYVRPANWASI